jgi:hypothetical protein
MAGEKSTTYAGQLLALLFNATSIANIAINATSSPLTNLFVSLHTADPTASGNQTTSEVTYTSYSRVTVARTTGGWTVTGASVSPVANIVFPSPTGAATQTATNWAVGTASTGAGTILYTGPISPTIAITVGLPPTLTTATTVTEA